MDWKKLGRVARLVAYAVVPGAAGYAAYRYVVRPWLDSRKEKSSGNAPQGDERPPQKRPTGRRKTPVL
jgi:hypothetical protein